MPSLQLVAAHSPIPKLIGYEHLQGNQALHKFLVCSLPDGAKEEVPLSWLYSIFDVSQDVSALPLAASAVGHGRVGNVDGVPEVIGKARSYYTGALHQMHKLLLDYPGSQTDALLATMECLALYEIFEFGTEPERGWLTHLSGIEVMIKMRGRQMHVAGFGNKMFMFSRTIAIFKALLRRKPTFLAESEWKYIPWTLTSKNTFHQYLDLAAEVPDLLEHADNLSAAPTISRYQDLLALLRKITDILERTNTWADQSGVRLPSCPPNVLSTRTTSNLQPEYILSPRARTTEQQHDHRTLRPSTSAQLPKQNPPFTRHPSLTHSRTSVSWTASGPSSSHSTTPSTGTRSSRQPSSKESPNVQRSKSCLDTKRQC